MGLLKKSRTEGVSDPVKLLVIDHQKVERLFADLKSKQGAAERQGLVAQLDFELSRHTEIEELVVYPYIRDNVPGGREMIAEAKKEHGEATKLLQQVVAS